MSREVLLDRLLAQQTRYAKERRHRLRIPDGLAQRRKTLFDLARRLSRRHFADGVVLGVVGDGVALVVNAPHHRWIGARHLPDHEEGRLHTFRCEALEDGVGVTRHRTIVECQHDLMIIKRQRFGILHGADTGMLVGIDHECATDPSAPGGHCSASAVPISKTRMAHATMVLRMVQFKPRLGRPGSM